MDRVSIFCWLVYFVLFCLYLYKIPVSIIIVKIWDALIK